LPNGRSCRQINGKGVGERSVQAGYPEVESYTMSAGLTTPIDYGLGHACKAYSELSFRLSPSSKSVKLRICLNQSGFGSVGPNQCSVSRFTRSSSKGSVGSIGRGSAARLSSFSIFCGCSMSSIEMAEPQCAQIESVARSIDAPQLEQFTVSIFCRSSLISFGDSARMKFFSRRKSKNPIERPCSLPHLE